MTVPVGPEPAREPSVQSADHRPPPPERTGVRAAYRELSKLSFPAHYPLVQFPNPPLWLALLASVVGWFVSGAVQDYVTAVGIVGITAWAWLELVDGVNLFRRLLGLAALISTVMGLADRLG